ncbi:MULTISPECIES: methionine ABC transporter permease [Planococcus]|uniref:D-methionine transport system permease protein n=2 Tax=Planococcus TaxID=1372 RepID=A0A497YLQ4_9BACL|nr:MULTISPECIES: methionine ABC transporter permease [Planococcus]AUD14820.1 methionine ABC transporter permease [Planococcus sp. MB-3u-03]MDE0582674.1 ABC transporter permease [Planococcus sp. A6]PKG45139.1 methionine ABC transporter permease [Planococcus sp. Urea-trap-24]PKG87481.1 methionine ABC transporter permease [Planococcus sp. Urea-3u-39]PKH42606.1 methionine ABC transporter permease [Planococcus sp. MB-3u-09]
MGIEWGRIIELWPEIQVAFYQTLIMIGISLGVALVIGLPLGILLFITDRGLFWENRPVNSVIGFVVNIVRSIPFIILLVALIPLTQLITGTTIGPVAASVSLSVAAIPFFARIVETALRDIDKGVIEAAIAVGATPWMIIKDVLLPEAKASLIQGITLTVISLIAYSAMAGVVGGGGIGDLAIRFGYYRYDNTIMIVTVVILIVLVQLIQQAGDFTAKKLDKR